MFELALAFQACIELLASVGVTVSMGFQEVTAAVGHHRDIASAVQPHRVDQTLLAELSEVAVAWIGGRSK